MPVGFPLSAVQCEARAEALEEAARHLLLSWTIDPVEIKQGEVISEHLEADAQLWHAIAKKLREKHVQSA